MKTISDQIDEYLTAHGWTKCPQHAGQWYKPNARAERCQSATMAYAAEKSWR